MGDEVLAHAFGVGFKARKEAEGIDGLMYGHSTAVDCATTGGARCAEEFRFEWEVDDLCDPKSGMQQRRGQRRAWMAAHSGGGGVDEAIGMSEARVNSRCRADAVGVEGGAVMIDERGAAGIVGIEDCEMTDAHPEQRVSGCGASATGAELNNMRERGVWHGAEKTFAEAGPIGIVADALAVAKEDGVYGADCRCVGGDLVKERKDGLLAGMRDVKAGESLALRVLE
jgi:hypothetical protein